MFNIMIITGTKKHIPGCIEAVKNSELGQAYNRPFDYLQACFTEGIKSKEIYVAVNEDSVCLGFIWIVPKGVFCEFPYCKIIAVRKECRSQGIGTALLQHFESLGFANSTKIFINVSDFNMNAKKLYENLGYKEYGLVPDLFKTGISEYIMMKARGY
ncbi:GNAT family N-acetyltransferase [Candidatus Contubernalis alkaliaceticus]|uniref:GNAT family N-acetyltransferase n=1 Tax=Candidatus Contubernalis alkaliaceticus TaxID=338645 RepID=UPI001F4C21B0|nr:GNAT family N-acetyltransferase [Candidatus Contubernalis alkalaceticus]UNC91559.1 GNAT family N-acetyltransferase [Candidatus Contubernalis alkalaceticus]